MRRLLSSYLNKEIASADLTIHYYIAGGLGGETNFRLHGDGRVELYSNVTSHHQRKRYSGQVSVSQVENVVQKMQGPGSGKFGIIMPIGVSTNLGENGCRGSAFAKVQRQLFSLIHEVSQEEVLEC